MTKETAFYTVFPEKRGTEIFGNILSGILVPFDFPLEFPEFRFAFLKFKFPGFSGNLPRKSPYHLAPFPKFRNLCLNTYGKFHCSDMKKQQMLVNVLTKCKLVKSDNKRKINH